MRKKSKIRKSIKDKLATALIDFLVGLILSLLSIKIMNVLQVAAICFLCIGISKLIEFYIKRK